MCYTKFLNILPPCVFYWKVAKNLYVSFLYFIKFSIVIKATTYRVLKSTYMPFSIVGIYYNTIIPYSCSS
nr:MAG TPA: RNA binding protein [Caudoviricetes sp.]